MIHPRSFRFLSAAAALALPSLGAAAPVISEIFSHSPAIPEDVTQEWLEIYNPDATAVDVSGWKLDKGVAFTFPAATSIPALGRVVVAANVTAFNAAHPGFVGTVMGNWVGGLANSGEQIRLVDALGLNVNDVAYANEGDWGLRARGPLSFSHQGWIWESAADGGGKSLELRNAALGNGNGQNWAESTAAGGTPGAANSVASTNVAPLIKAAEHKPNIPHSTDAIKISCALEDEAATPTATLHWRLDGAASYTTAAMTDSDGDGRVDATIPPQANLSVIEWYVSATDGTNTRTWPAAAKTSGVGVTPVTFGQVTNALLQVDDSYSAARNFTTPGNQPVYRLIMTSVERAELVTIGTTFGQEDSEATMNGTFVSFDGTGTKVRYRSGFRNRGQASALGPPNNYHVSFPSDNLWEGRSAFALNCQFPYSQALGEALMRRAGIATQEAAMVQVRVNGTDLASGGAVMYGRYARVEGRGGDWAKAHFPADPDGNFYRLDDHAYPQGDARSGEFGYEGESAASYADTFLKETNKEEADYSDLIALAKIISAPATGGSAAQPAISDAAYPAAVATVFDIDQFYRFIAADALIGNQEGGLQSGRADDASIYRGMIDTRFRFVPHDFDDVFDIGAGVGDPITRSLFSYNTSSGGLTGLSRMFNHPQLLPRYYSALLDAMNSWFNHPTADPIIDQIMAGWVPATDGSAATPNRGVAEIKGFIDDRRNTLLPLIPQTYALNITGTAADTAEGYKVTTTGVATFAGNFNVAKTYSITVNGTLAQTFYRTAGADAVGTWKLITTTGGSGVITPGLNKVVVRFWDGINGTGNVLRELTSNVYYSGGAGTVVAGTLSAPPPPGSLELVAPTNYIPGVPFLVRVNQKNAAGALDRNAWNGTAALTTTGGVTITPNTVTLTNGMGSALVTVGGGASNVSTTLIAKGGTSGSPNNAATAWNYHSGTVDTAPANDGTGKVWSAVGYADATWASGVGELGNEGNATQDQRTTIANVAAVAVGGTGRRTWYFRKTFTVANPASFTALTLKLLADDGAAVYLNGNEITAARRRLPTGTLTHTTFATIGISGSGTTPLETEFETIDISSVLGQLVTGTNTLAVEVHNASASQDLSFDLELIGTASGGGSSDPGNFALTATASGYTQNKALTSAGATPTMTNVSGTLPAGTTTWSGIMNVTGDVTVPTGATLQIQPGTMVLVAGTAYVQGTAAVDTGGADLIVNGNLQALGTAANPISICCSNAANRWGELNFGSTATASTLQYCLMSRSGHSPSRGGHIPASGGAMFMVNGTTLTIDDSVMADGVGKTMANSGNANITIRRSHAGRFTMGPELGDSAITIEDSNFTDMLQIYRERGAQDDEDCLYIHSSGGRPVNLRRSVFARCDDDALDLLAGSLTVEDCIIRNAFDKGVSMLQNNITMLRCLIIDNDVGVSAKCQTGADESVPYLTVLEGCTIRCENHPTNTGDQSPLPAPQFHSVGVHTRNKYGTTTMNITQQIKDCIIVAEEPLRNDYPTVNSTTYPGMSVTYSCYQDLLTPTQPTVAGTGNITANPLFVDALANDFRLQATSPCRDTGDIALTDPDTTRIDMGALPYTLNTGGGTGELIWNLAGSPYRVTTTDVVVPVGLTLRIDPGVNVLFDQNRKLTVNGTIRVLGTANQGVVFSNVPGTTATDPITNQANQPMKWAGLVVQGPSTGPAITGHEFRYCTFFNAQPAVSAGNTGSLGIIRAQALIDHCIFLGTHLRQVYGENCSLQVQYSTFVDPFDPAVDADNPTNPPNGYGLDNIAEPLKIANANFAGNANYTDGMPNGGYFRIYYNTFKGNKGHNDVFDADAGILGRSAILDCRYNNFEGLTGDEHIDLGGDAYVASNVFQRGHKDKWTNDHGYSNCISSGDKGSGTSIWVVRNTAFDVDHMINCKLGTATIFEHNTIANFTPDFQYASTLITPAFTQNVRCGAINFYVPDDSGPSRGDGGYIGYNIFHNMPRVVTWADLPAPYTTKLDAEFNYLNNMTDNSVGPVDAQFSGGTKHPGGFTSIGSYVAGGDPQFINEAGKNYGLKATSPARGTAEYGLDYGATVAEWAHILGGPESLTDATTASFVITGPGMASYKWRLDGGAWSAETTIGTGLSFPRTGATVRKATLTLNALTPGPHTLEVLGRDPAGNWQDADPARTAAGLPQAVPTVRTWTVDNAGTAIRITEVAANTADGIDWIELKNLGITNVDLGGWFLTDQASVPNKYAIPVGTIIAAGGYVKIDSTTSGLHLDKDGDDVSLYLGTVLEDTIAFGPLPLGYTLGRVGNANAWALCSASPLASNTAVPLGSNTNIRLSEWLASSDIHYKSDWIELVNLDLLPVSLAGLVLTDNRPGLPAQFVIPPYSYIAASGFQTYIADSDPAAGPNHLNFGLDVQQETISLLNGSQLQDEVQFYPQIDDYSQNRDVTGLPIYNVLPTIGFTNGTSDPAYANALAILNGLRISEIMYNAQGGNDYDWIELRNIGPVSLNLGGVSFIQGISFTFPTMSLAPGAEIVLVANSTAFTGRYGGAVTIAGTYTGKLDNGGETLALALPAPWDACVLVFAYNDAWYPNTDGLGKALDLITNQTVLHNFGDRDSWQESAAIGGSPTGQILSVPSAYVPWLAYFTTADGADADRDGLSSLVEFGLGLNPLSGSAGNGASGAPTPSVSPDNRITLSFALPVNVPLTSGHGQNEVTYEVQISDDLQSNQWTTIATKSPTTAWAGAATVTTGTAVGGFIPITVKDTSTLATKSRHFMRLNMTWTP